MNVGKKNWRKGHRDRQLEKNGDFSQRGPIEANMADERRFWAVLGGSGTNSLSQRRRVQFRFK
jgi:hypothetical protein